MKGELESQEGSGQIGGNEGERTPLLGAEETCCLNIGFVTPGAVYQITILLHNVLTIHLTVFSLYKLYVNSTL